MGKIDVMTKEYMSKNERFADAFNYFLYGGREVLHAENLEERDPSELLVLDTKEAATSAGHSAKKSRKKSSSKVETTETHKRERDLLRNAVIRIAGEVCYVLLGLENSFYVDYGMPVRKMLYESLRYDQQKKAIAYNYASKHNNHKVHMTPSEFLSGIRKGDKLIPVITLTMYFGQEEWDAPLSIHEMLDIKDRSLLPYIENYKVNLISPQNIEDFSVFRTDLRLVLEMLKAANDKQKIKLLLEGNDAFSNVGKDTAMIIKECTGIELEIDETEVTINMCKGFADLKQEYMDEGFSAAITGMVHKLFNKGIPPVEIAEIMEMTIEKVQDILKQ